MTAKILIPVLILVCLFMLFIFWRNDQVAKFRRELEEGDPCKVYHGENKCYGRVRLVYRNAAYVKYTDEDGKVSENWFRIEDIYPQW